MTLQKLALPPEQASYSVSATEDILTVKLRGGLSRSRKDAINSACIINCTWRLNVGDYQYFRAFFNTATQKGLLPFLIDLLLEQPYLEEYEARFIPDTVTMSEPLGLSRLCSAQLEVIPVVDTEMDEILILIYGTDILNYIEHFANFGIIF